MSPGALGIPHVFAGEQSDSIANFDANWAAIATYVNAREINQAPLANRPAAGTAGAWFFASDTGALYFDNGSTWVLVALSKANLAESLSGLTLSNDGALPNTVLDIAAGAASSDDATIANRVLMTLGAFTKNMNASWVAGTGNGGNNAAGALGASTWYDVFEIQRPDTGVVDVLCDTTLTPVLPANYTKKRRLGSFKTNGASQIIAFTQESDYFRWSLDVLDVNTNNPGVAAVTATLASVPLRTPVQALIRVALRNAGTASSIIVSDLAASDQAPAGAAAAIAVPMFDTENITNPSDAVRTLQIRTNALAQIRYRLSASDANVTVGIVTMGWIDRRGRG